MRIVQVNNYLVESANVADDSEHAAISNRIISIDIYRIYFSLACDIANDTT